MRKGNKQLLLDKSSCSTSLTKSDSNKFEEKYDCQFSLDVESLPGELYLNE